MTGNDREKEENKYGENIKEERKRANTGLKIKRKLQDSTKGEAEFGAQEGI